MADGGDSWLVWLDEHDAALVLLARHWVATHADAEDVVQEAFVRFWRSRDSVQEPIAYLYSCVKHCALDWQRGRQRRQQRELAAARPEAEPLFVAPIEQGERRIAIEAALLTTADEPGRGAGDEDLGRAVVSADRSSFGDFAKHSRIALSLRFGEARASNWPRR